MVNNLTEGSIIKNLLRFSLPYLLACFLQTFYGLADLFIIGQFNGAASITAVSVGSQVTHMLTVIIVGLAMGSTVTISRAIGAKNSAEAAKGIGNTVLVFGIFAIVATIVLLIFTDGIISILATPTEAIAETKEYLTVCFIGVPFIVGYNVISSIFRGLGDTKRPMYFVAIAGVINIILDYIFIGPLGMGAMGAALATIIAQCCSVILALIAMKRIDLGVSVGKNDLKYDSKISKDIIRVGSPIALQDGFIQIAFLVITIIANMRGVDVAAAVGIVEKVICFMFLVPSAMLSAVSALVAQNVGAGKHDRGRKTLAYGIYISVAVGIFFALVCQFKADWIISVFSKTEPDVIVLGAQYLKAYALDCAIAGVHFCFSGYFCAYQRSMLSFAHNLASIVLVRIPGAYLAAVLFPATLYPMGLAAPLGSLLSSIICIVAYLKLRKTAFC